MIRLSLLFLLISYPISVSAQYPFLRLKVIDGNEKFPLAGASVVSGNTTFLTDPDGYFKVALEKLGDYSLKVSYVGYETKIVNINKKDSLTVVELTKQRQLLPSVVISTEGMSIIAKAIKNIKKNYPQKNFIVDGIFRTFQRTRDSFQYLRYCQIDAKMKVLYKPYSQHHQDPKVYIKDKKQQFYASEQLHPDTSRWVNGFLIVPHQDFVYSRPAFISKHKKYNFIYQGVSDLDNRKVFVLDFYAKDSDNTEGTLFIDTLTYAFVGANYNRYKIKHFLAITITRLVINVRYKEKDNKWFLSLINTSINYESKYNQVDDRITAFYTTGVNDTSGLTGYYGPIEEGDQDVSIPARADSLQREANDSTFLYAEKNGFIPMNDDEFFNTRPVDHKKEAKSKLPSKMKNYLSNNNLSCSYYFKRNEFQLEKSDKMIHFSNFSFGSDVTFRLTKNLFGSFVTTFNFYTNKITYAGNGLKILYDLKLDKINIPVKIFLLTGYSTNTIKQNKVKLGRFTNWYGGMRLVKALSAKFNYFSELNYMANSGLRTAGDIKISPKRFSYSAGLIFKL